jgi:hypothetical protein
MTLSLVQILQLTMVGLSVNIELERISRSGYDLIKVLPKKFPGGPDERNEKLRSA